MARWPATRSAGSGTSDDAGRAAVYGAGGQPVAAGGYKLLVTDAGAAEDNPMEAVKATKPRVPAAYAKPATTPASVTVEAGKSEYVVELKSKP